MAYRGIPVLQALVDEGDDPRHEGSGWHVRCRLTDGSLICLAMVDHGPGWLKLALEHDEAGGSWIFITEAQICWAVPDFDCEIIRPEGIFP